jgi:hypothetical protein
MNDQPLPTYLNRGSPGRLSRIGLVVTLAVALGAAVAFFSR